MAKRKMRRRGKRWQGDFREFDAYGGGRETLRLPGEAHGVADKQTAEQLYDARLAELLARRASAGAAPKPGQAHENGGDVSTLGGLLDYHIALYAPYVDTRVTRDRRRYRRIILELLPAKMPVRALTRDEVKAFLGELRDATRTLGGAEFSGVSRGKIFGLLRAALDTAIDKELIQANPAAHIPDILLPSSVSKDTKFFSIEQGGRILDALKRDSDGGRPATWAHTTPDYLYEFVAFALLTGARRNEIQAQRWEWVDWNAGLVQVYTSKRHRGEDRGRLGDDVMRVITLWPQLREALLALWERQGRPSCGLVFPKLRLPTRPKLHRSRVERGGKVGEKAIRSVLRQQGLVSGGRAGEGPLLFEGEPGFTIGFREFRVTYCATRLQTVEPVADRPGVVVGVAQQTVVAELGHKSNKMVERIYGKVKGRIGQIRLMNVAYPSARETLHSRLVAG